MKTFKELYEEVKKPTGKLKSACWTGYTAVGTKEKGGRTVPNCVPVKEATNDEIGEMVNDKLEIIIKHAQEMQACLKNAEELPEWVKSKITLAQDYVVTASNYICVNEEMGAGAVSSGPTNVTGTATSTDPVSATAVDMKKKKKPIVLVMARRKPPKL